VGKGGGTPNGRDILERPTEANSTEQTTKEPVGLSAAPTQLSVDGLLRWSLRKDAVALRAAPTQLSVDGLLRWGLRKKTINPKATSPFIEAWRVIDYGSP
jgi:hypothetical protein